MHKIDYKIRAFMKLCSCIDLGSRNEDMQSPPKLKGWNTSLWGGGERIYLKNTFFTNAYYVFIDAKSKETTKVLR